MKKLLSLLLVVCLAVSFSIGCGSQAPPPDGGSVDPAEEEMGEEYEAGEAGIGEDEGGAPEETTGEAP